MSDKSPRKSMSKKSGKSLKEKRSDKKSEVERTHCHRDRVPYQETLTLDCSKAVVRSPCENAP